MSQIKIKNKTGATAKKATTVTNRKSYKSRLVSGKRDTIRENANITSGAKQISARLDGRTYGAFKEKLTETGLSQQDFIDTVIRAFLKGGLSVIKSFQIDVHPLEQLHYDIAAGDGYTAEGIDDLMDQLEGRKPPKKIKR